MFDNLLETKEGKFIELMKDIIPRRLKIETILKRLLEYHYPMTIEEFRKAVENNNLEYRKGHVDYYIDHSMSGYKIIKRKPTII